MAVERRSALTKASTPDDPLAGMGVDLEQAPPPAVVAKPAAPRSQRASRADAGASTPAATAASPAPSPRPVGRPRTRPLQVTFSSKVDLEVRARLDAWEYETGEKIVELLDRALRDAMGMPAPGAAPQG